VAALVFVAAEMGGAILARWRIRKAAGLLGSGWTVVAVVTALLAVLVNTLMGLEIG
jgi:hypothetical protein